jgi:toxin CptA
VSARTERRIPELRIDLRVSRALAFALAGAHAAAAGAVFASVAQWHFGAAAGVVLAASACWTIRRHALLLAHRAVVRLELRDECECRTTQRDGSSTACRIRGSSYVSTWLIVLHLFESGRRFDRRIVLLPDGIGRDRFRRLRVRLRWCAPHPGGIVTGDAPL